MLQCARLFHKRGYIERKILVYLLLNVVCHNNEIGY